MDEWLSAGLDAGDEVPHGVHAGLGGVHFDHVLQLSLASVQLVLPVLAQGLALLYQQRFWIFSLLEHGLDIA